jgi:hypothetical protein
VCPKIDGKPDSEGGYASLVAQDPDR